MCFTRVTVIVIVILRYDSREGLLKYINVGDKSTMVARLPQQVFLLLVLVTGTTMGIGMYGMGLPKSTKFSHSTDIREDETSGNHPTRKIPHKIISRLEEASNSQIPVSKSYFSNIRRKNLEDRNFANWNQEILNKNTESKLRREESKNNFFRDENASPLLNSLTDRVELQSISTRDGFVRPRVKESWETSSSSAFYYSLEDPPSLRSLRTSRSFLLSNPTSHRLSLSSSSMTSPYSSNDMLPTSPSSRSLSSEVSFALADDYPKTTLPSSSTSTNSISVSRILELNVKFSQDGNQIEDEKIGSRKIGDSKSEWFLNQILKTTQPSSSTSTKSVPLSWIFELDDEFSKSADQIEDEKIGSREIGNSKSKRFLNQISKATQPNSSTRTNSVPLSRIFELDDKFSKSANQIEDEKIKSREIGESNSERFLNQISKTTQPRSSTTTNSVPLSRIFELDDKFSKSANQIEDEKIKSREIGESNSERFLNQISKTTQPWSSTTTNSVPLSRIFELDDKFSKSANEIEDTKIRSREIGGSNSERFSNQISKTTQPRSSTTTNSVPLSRIFELDDKFSKSADQIEDEKIGSREIGNSKSKRFLNKISKTTQSSSSTSTNSVPLSRIFELDDKFSKSANQIEDEKIRSREIGESNSERFSNQISKTTQPRSSTTTNSVPLSRIFELDDKFSKSANQIEDEKIKRREIGESNSERFLNPISKTTQPSSSTTTNSVPLSRIFELDDKFSKSADQIEDKTMESSKIEISKMKTFSNEFSETTQPSSSTSTNQIPISRILESNDKFSKSANHIEDKTMGSNEIEVSMIKRFPNEFPQTTTLSLSASISSIPVRRIPELAKKFSNVIVRIEDTKIGSSKIEVSRLTRFPNQLYSFGRAKEILTTELPTKALSIVHQNKMKSSMRHFFEKENEIRHFDWLSRNRAALTAITLPQSTGFGFSKRYTRDSPDIDMCESFEIGDPVKREFYSPNYPENYPKLINCVLVLEAEKGQLLKLDFRETFELESRAPDGECRFDYLEVRDGQYGFSPKIGTYCDKTFPPEIISQSRYLWLNFHSDDTIEYQGFKAVWSTVPRPNTDAIAVEQEPCIYYEDIPADFELKSVMIKDAKKISEKNRVALDCLWVLKAPESMKMQLTFDSFKLEKPNDCSANFLDIFDGETDEPSRVKKFCGSIAEALSTKTNRMYVRLYLEPKAINSSFDALITAVRDKDANQVKCKPDEFDCQDATCIALTLRCNSRKNCRFQGDEAQLECGTSSEKQDRSRIVIILVIFSLIMFGMCTAFVFNCVRKLRRDHRIIREHIRQSREDRLDEIGRRTTPCPLSVSRTDLRDGGSESPAGEEVDSSKELIPPATLTTREYTKELTLKMKYGTKEITDIHQSNNVSNATQERLQESSEEPDMCDSSCQTRESLFAPIIPDAILSSPAFSTFGYETISGPENGLSHKNTPTSDYRHHSHQHHPPSLKQISQTSQESHRKNSQVSGYPFSERCSHEGSAQICPKHNPIPAPPGWSLHDPPYPQIVPEPSGCPGGVDNSSYRRYQSPKPDHESSIGPSIYQQHQYQYPPPVFTRQNTVGSGERYGSYIYGSGRASSNTASSNATTTSATTTPTTSNTTGSGSPHLATPKHSKIDPRYRAEAVIEVDQKRPFSIESTKSAPDVIATH